jgi:hypothetical protein
VHFATAAVANHISRLEGTRFIFQQLAPCGVRYAHLYLLLPSSAREAACNSCNTKNQSNFMGMEMRCSAAAANNKKDEDMRWFEQHRHYKQIITFGHEQDKKWEKWVV